MRSVCVSDLFLFPFFKSTHEKKKKKKALATLECPMPCKWSLSRRQEWVVLALSMKHLAAHQGTAAGSLTCRGSVAWWTPSESVASGGSQELVESRGGGLTCKISLVEAVFAPQQPLCFDLVLIH